MSSARPWSPNGPSRRGGRVVRNPLLRGRIAMRPLCLVGSFLGRGSDPASRWWAERQSEGWADRYKGITSRPQRRGETHPSATRDSGCRIELVLGARRCCAVSDRSNTPLIPDEFGVPPQSSVAVGRSATQRAAKCSHLTPIVSYLTRRFCAFLVRDGAPTRSAS